MSYAYLWQREARAGQDEGLKDRPVVVVVAQIVVNGLTQLFVAPITHSKPNQGNDAVALPQSVKHHLGLDRDQSWIVTTELNRFTWPGPDVRPITGNADASPLFGEIPEWLLERVKAAILEKSNTARLKVTPRRQ